MKRFWIGALVLCALCVGGIGVCLGFSQAHQTTALHLQQAGDAAAAGDWQQALDWGQQASQQWQAWWKFTAIFSDHAPMEEIDSLFARLTILGQQSDRAQYAALCAQLSQRILALADSQALHWWTLF